MAYRDSLLIDQLKPEEQAAFKTLKLEIEHKWTHLNSKQKLWLTDECLCRYLRARKYDVLLAKNMIAETLDFRSDKKPHRIKWQAVEKFGSHLSNYFHMTDKVGHPVCYLRFARDPPKEFNADERVQFVTFAIEEGIRIIELNKEKYPHIEKMIYIIDLSEFSLSAPGADLGVSKQWAELLSKMYPERMYRAYLMNYPGIFHTFWTACSLFMDPVQKDKVRWVPDHGSIAERGDWFESEGFDKDMLETDLGGNVPPLTANNFTQAPNYSPFPMKK
eukprot:TRINITY_DN779_c0_g1_i12.p1 TRINITY_DN779_c0_g1~~TRINITY_DN779_c0_g1_i12.p1  ORF type:complete len:275 (+),score=112.61 TRINITY_DN779_c0_g1_i12:55-879(+)